MNPQSVLASNLPAAVRGTVRNVSILFLSSLLACRLAQATNSPKISEGRASEESNAVAQRLGYGGDPKLEALLRDAFGSLKNKQYDVVISRCSAAFQMTRDRTAAGYIHYLRAAAYLKKNELTKALDDANEAINLFPRLSGAYVVRGFIYGQRKEHDKAIRDYDTAIGLNPYSKEAYMQRAYEYCEKGDYRSAIRDYSEVIRRAPKDFTARYSRGLAYDQLDDWNHALADHDEAIRLSPGNADGYFARGTVHEEKGNYREAASDFAIALSKKPSDQETLNAIAWLKATCPDASLRNGKEALKLSLKTCQSTGWHNSSFLDTLAAAYAELGAFDQAVKYQTLAVNMKGAAKNHREYEQRLHLYQEHKPYRNLPSVPVLAKTKES